MHPDSSPLSSSLKREQQDSLVHLGSSTNRPESLSEGFDGSTVRVGPNHSTIEIWYDTAEQARTAHSTILLLIGGAIPEQSSGVHTPDQPVEWVGSDGTSHSISLDYAAEIAKWVFDTYGDVPQVDAAIRGVHTPGNSNRGKGNAPLVSKEWLEEKLAIADDSMVGAPPRPCDKYPGCNANNCLGCGEGAAL